MCEMIKGIVNRGYQIKFKNEEEKYPLLFIISQFLRHSYYGK